MFVAQSYGQDTLIYPINNSLDPTQTATQSFDLGDPSAVQPTIVYDPGTGTYIFQETIGALNYRNPSMMTLEEYIEDERQKALQENWKEKIDEQTAELGARFLKTFLVQIKLQFVLREVLNFRLGLIHRGMIIL